MTIKFDRPAGNEFLEAAQNAAFTFPNGDWALSWVMSFPGSLTGEAQYIFSNDVFAAAGSLQVTYQAASATNPGKIAVFAGTVTTPLMAGTTTMAANAVWGFLLQRSGTTLTLYRCPILATAPVDGSAVVTEASATLSVALAGTQGVHIGARADEPTNRMSDQAIGRMFKLTGTLTPLEFARLCYGEDIQAQLGKSPDWYVRMDTVSDIADRGPSNITFVPNGTLATASVQPSFGYVPGAVAPSITGTPTIIGTPQVGIATSYTPATASGSPVPTRTQQWRIDGVDVSGATAASYTPISADAGKTLTVRQIETNGNGSPATATSSGVVVAAATVEAVTVTAPTAERIYPRNGTSAAVPFSGTFSGNAPTAIQYRLVNDANAEVLAWTDMSATINAGGGTWSATPLVPQGGMYRVEVRSMSGAAQLAVSGIAANKFGVGAIFAFGGSSSAERMFNNLSGTGFTPAANVRRYQTSHVLFGTVGAAINVANGLAQELGVPVLMVDAGDGGTTLSDWINSGGTAWNNFKTRVTNVGGKLEGVFVAVGSNDPALGQVVSRSGHLTKLRALVTNIRNHTGQSALKILIAGMNRRTAHDAGVTDATFNTQTDYVRMAENDIGDDANVAHVTAIEYAMDPDLTHLSPAGYTSSGAQQTTVMRTFVTTGNYPRGPKITAVTYIDDKFNVTLSHRHGTNFTPTTGITGFTAGDDSGALTVTAARLDSTHIEVTANRAIGANPWLKYMSGGGVDVAAPVRDNGSLSLLMHPETDLVATSSAVADTTSPALTGNVTAASITTTGAVISWPAATDNVGVVSYEYSTNGGSSYTNTGTNRTATLTGLTPATTYQLRARAYDAAGNVSSAITGTLVTATPADTTAPVLTGSVTAASITTTGAVISWPAATDDVGVTNYEYSTNGGTSYTSTGTTRTATLSGLNPSTVYALRARAYDAAGNVSAAITGSLTTATPPDTTAPTLTGSITVSGVTSTEATIAGPVATDAVGVTGYEYSINGGNTYVNLGTNRTANLTGLTPATEYQIRYRAYDAAGNRSTPLSATLTTVSLPPVDPVFIASKIRTIKAKPGGLGFIGNEFWSLSDPLKPTGRIDPNATIDITMVWTLILEDISDSIASVSVEAVNAIAANAYTVGNETTVFVSGAPGSLVQVRFRLETASSPPRIEDRTVYLKVADQ